jgi:plastocyanin
VQSDDGLHVTGRLLPLVLFASACFNPDEPACSFVCGDNGACPDDYTCAADGYCHKNGDTSACGFSDAAAPGDDLSAGMDLAGHDLAEPDGPSFPFQSLAPCNNASDFSAASSIHFGNSLGFMFSPNCVLTHVGSSVSWSPASGGSDDFSTHPLTPSTRGSSGNPIPLTMSGVGPVNVTFPTAGFYPFYCGMHGANDGSGMSGVIQVAP